MIGASSISRPLRVAFPSTLPVGFGGPSGGSSAYEASIEKMLNVLESEGAIEVVPLLRRRKGLRAGGAVGKRSSQGIVLDGPGFLELLFFFFPAGLFGKLLPKLRFLRLERVLQAREIDLVYLPSPSPIALRLDTTPFIFTIWDFGHEELAGFPEASSRWEWNFRQKLYGEATSRALHVFVDSERTKTKLRDRYRLEENRVSVLGLLPDVPEQVADDRLVGKPYIIYPATRWKHKNHKTLLRALQIVVEEHPSLSLVLTGANGGYQSAIERFIEELNVGDNVIDLGHLDRNSTLSLIKGANALVMPSLLGPTNLPPLEALALGTRVVVSDLHDYGGPIDEEMVKVPALNHDEWAEANYK